MLQVIEKAVEKVATEWVEKQFAEIFLKEERNRYGDRQNTNRLAIIVERIVEQEIKNITVKHLEQEKLDIKQIVLERLATVKDKIEINIKSY